MSRGIFGATVGIDRLLKLFNKYDIKATWFAPAHTLESFPGQIRKIVNAGHEIGLHGYTHEHVGKLSVKQQKDVLEKSIKVLHEFTGTRPRGWIAPGFSTSQETVELLEFYGIVSFLRIIYASRCATLMPVRNTITPLCTTTLNLITCPTSQNTSWPTCPNPHLRGWSP